MKTTQIIELARINSTPLMVTDCDIIRNNYYRLQKALPNVKLHFAIKPFPHSTVLKTLHDIGSGFDVATNGEIALLKKSKIPATSCIHTHPIKRNKDIKEALKYGITQFVVDNIEEIDKFKKYYKKVKLSVRVAFSSPTATIDLSKKFGCDPKNTIELLEYAKTNKIRVNGLCFHVGSQSMTPDMYVTAINTCTTIIAESILKGLPAIEILDIGGGFPVEYDLPIMDIEAFCKPICEALSHVPSHVKIFAEPGRFIVGPASISVATIIGKRKYKNDFYYYIDDGIYDSYSLQFFDTVVPQIDWVSNNKDNPEVYPSKIFGITCDSTDTIRELLLPELAMGDYILGFNMGAYSSVATGTNFNMVDRAKNIFINV